MNFRDFASTEASAFIERLTTAAQEAAATAAREIRVSADAEIEQIRAAAERSRHDAEDLRQQVTAHGAELAQLRAHLDAESVRVAEALAERDAEAVRAAEALEQLDAAANEAHKAWTANEELVRDLRAQVEAAETAARHGADRGTGQQVGALLGESIDAFDALATATTVDELFRRLVEQTAAQFPRVVIFRRKGQRLEGELATGLDASVDLTDVALTMSADSIITTAASQGVYECATTEQLADAHRLPGQVPRFAVAAPLVFQGETLAVLYADTRQDDKGEAHAAFAGVLAAHTNVLLSRLTQELKIARELREYAQMLLHEAEEMFVADTREGRTRPDRLRRLRDTIDFGRQLYAQRAALEGPSAAGLLDEEIAVLVDADPGTEFSDALCDALADAPAPASV